MERAFSEEHDTFRNALASVARDGRRHRASLPLRRLQLHEDRGESLGQVVVNIAREPIAFLEDCLAPFFDPIVLDEPAVMQRQRRLPRDRLDQHDAAPVAFRIGPPIAAHRHPAEHALAEPQRRGHGRLPVHLGGKGSNRIGESLVG